MRNEQPPKEPRRYANTYHIGDSEWAVGHARLRKERTCGDKGMPVDLTNELYSLQQTIYSPHRRQNRSLPERGCTNASEGPKVNSQEVSLSLTNKSYLKIIGIEQLSSYSIPYLIEDHVTIFNHSIKNWSMGANEALYAFSTQLFHYAQCAAPLTISFTAALYT